MYSVRLQYQLYLTEVAVGRMLQVQTNQVLIFLDGICFYFVVVFSISEHHLCYISLTWLAEPFKISISIIRPKHIIISVLMSASIVTHSIFMWTPPITVMSFPICRACVWGWCSVAEGQAKANRGVFLIWLLTHCRCRVNTDTQSSGEQMVIFCFFMDRLNVLTSVKISCQFNFTTEHLVSKYLIIKSYVTINFTSQKYFQSKFSKVLFSDVCFFLNLDVNSKM